MTTATITNWDKTQSWTPELIHEPSGEDQIVAYVKQAADAGRPIKAIGSALSWSDCIDMPGRAVRFGPRYEDFNALRQRLDPQGLFRNRFVDRVFGVGDHKRE